MSKTQALRALIYSLLQTLPGQTYHRMAPDRAATPYKTFSLARIDLSDSTVDNFDLCVDLIDLSPDPKTVEGMADELEALLNVANLPQDAILPTFFRASRYPVEESDRHIQHLQLHFDVQLYETNTEEE